MRITCGIMKKESIVVGNGVVDAILNQFIERCSEKKIRLCVGGRLPADSFVAGVFGIDV